MEPTGPRRLPDDDEAASWTAEWRAVRDDEPFGQEDGWQRHPDDRDAPQDPAAPPGGSTGPDWPTPVTSLSEYPAPGTGGVEDWPTVQGTNPRWEPDAATRRSAPPGDLTGGWDATAGAAPGHGGGEDWPTVQGTDSRWEPDAATRRSAPPGDLTGGWEARPDPGWPEPVEATGTWFTPPDRGREWRPEETNRAVHPNGDALDDWRGPGPEASFHGDGGRDAWQDPHGGGAPFPGTDGGFHGDPGMDWQSSHGADQPADDGFRAGPEHEGWRESPDNAPGGWDHGDGSRDNTGWHEAGPADQATRAWTPEGPAHPGDRLVYSTAGPPPQTNGPAADAGPSFPDRPHEEDYDWDDEQSPRKRLALVLLSAAAAVLVLGGTVAGIHFLTSGNSQVAASCAPPDSCAQVTPAATLPATEATEPADVEDTEEPEETTEPVETEEAEPEPEPPVTQPTTAPEPRPTPERRPTPKRTKSTAPPKPRFTDEATPPSDVEETEDVEVEEEQQELGIPTPTDDPVTEEPTEPSILNPFGISSGGAVRVGFDVVNTGATRYTVELSVVNGTSGTMSGMRLSIPVNGVVTAVEGDVEWSQKDGVLTLTYDRALPVGEQTSITFTASGKVKTPTSCTIPRIRCRLT